MNCSTCGEPLVRVRMFRLRSGREVIEEMQTLMGYSSPPGHDHDDNCKKRLYFCKNDHENAISIRRRCSAPGCAWVGKERCFCHSGTKIDQWPELPPSAAEKGE